MPQSDGISLRPMTNMASDYGTSRRPARHALIMKKLAELSPVLAAI